MFKFKTAFLFPFNLRLTVSEEDHQDIYPLNCLLVHLSLSHQSLRDIFTCSAATSSLGIEKKIAKRILFIANLLLDS